MAPPLVSKWLPKYCTGHISKTKKIETWYLTQVLLKAYRIKSFSLETRRCCLHGWRHLHIKNLFWLYLRDNQSYKFDRCCWISRIHTSLVPGWQHGLVIGLGIETVIILQHHWCNIARMWVGYLATALLQHCCNIGSLYSWVQAQGLWPTGHLACDLWHLNMTITKLSQTIIAL